MKVGDVADYLRVPLSWVYESSRKRGIPFKRIGRHLRIRRCDLDNWVERQGDGS
jgi:excisionase family DNA binding protein